MKIIFIVSFIVTNIFLPKIIFPQDSNKVITWDFEKIDSIGGFFSNPLNRLPGITESNGNKVCLFNGIDEAILVDTNPIENATEFTIEAIIKPDSSFNPSNKEQRFIHIRNGTDDNRRILVELRLYPDQTWALDTFIKSEDSRCTLIDTTKRHPTGKWYRVALVYKNGIMSHFVNSEEEKSGSVNYLPIEDGRISIGARQDPRNWFKGEISKVRFTNCALEPKYFLK